MASFIKDFIGKTKDGPGSIEWSLVGALIFVAAVFAVLFMIGCSVSVDPPTFSPWVA